MSPFASILHRETLEKLAGGRALARGRDYFERGCVKALTRDGASLTGVVAGTSSYAVRLWVRDSSLAYSCTCPQGEEGEFCKHCVALSLAWLAEAAKVAPG